MRSFDIAVVIPTKGRDTLERCLESLMPKYHQGYGAEVIVVIDTFQIGNMKLLEIERLCRTYNVIIRQYSSGYHDWGYPQLDYVYKTEPFLSDFVMNIGDDDEIISGAFDKMKTVLDKNGLRPYMFQAILYPSSHRGNTEPVTLWNDENRTIERKFVTGQNLVVPTIPCLMGQWADDFVFIQETIEKWHGEVTWCPIPTVECH